MESDLQQHHHLFHTHQPPMMNPGLTRFRSAPSSFFANLLDSCEEFLNRPSSPETERMLTRLISGGNIGDGFQSSPAPPNEVNHPTPTPTNINTNITTATNNNSSNNQQSQFMGSIKSEAEVLHNTSHNNNYGSASSQSFYQIPSHPPLPNRNMRGNNTSSLIRQSSSPAGLFSNINIDNGFGAAVGGMRNFGASNGTNGGDGMFPPAARFNSQTNFSARVVSSMGQMSPIAEIGDKRMGSEIQDDGSFGEGQDNSFVAGFPVGSWDDATSVGENFSSLKRCRDSDQQTFSGMNASEAQNEETRGCAPPPLAHHLSLPKPSAEMSAIEKFFQLQDSVPCKIRAKRGCATHPRSIAERVRRTRISERMRKLQDLVPNMDKQTNTSDMLDLAVEYIKELQKQVKMLAANRARCTCLSRHQL